ncbi:sensor kinase/phosphatase LuxQ [Seminavis robusta]|uniref:histidine kinase n=1 Tax=Seminavis robusta TaxID=568900 RepID=A0A9N8DJ21_9STRA|nr:sensor kinase/phosphatase LuxQ [Seminavis robusta]|eukprot:Sro168_g074900.1 sensor kinase/phosphatase LuxQ (924) ;mRNA; r:80524-83515
MDPSCMALYRRSHSARNSTRSQPLVPQEQDTSEASGGNGDNFVDEELGNPGATPAIRNTSSYIQGKDMNLSSRLFVVDNSKNSNTPASSQTSQTSYTGDLATPTTDSYHGNDNNHHNTKSVSFTIDEKCHDHDDDNGHDHDDPNQKSKRTVNLKQWTDRWMNSHWPILLVSCLIFVVLAGAGISLYLVVATARDEELRDSILDLAVETGAWFAKELDFAILPLFSMAQFATELDIFADLPDQIKSPGQENALPFIPQAPDVDKAYRNITGVCDQPELVERFTEIASAVKRNAKMDGVLHNIQLAPQGVICLLHPMNNTEDFHDGKSFLDNTGAWGIDLLHDPFHRYIARKSLKGGEVGIVGPRRLFQCPTCGMYFIVRLPVSSRKHNISMSGEEYPKWGFTTALINWDDLVMRSDIHERFRSSGYEFQLTRTDHNFDDETNSYVDDIVVLAASEAFGGGSEKHQVSTALQTTNNEWVMTIQYYPNGDVEYIVVVLVAVLVAFFISALVYTVLLQKQTHTAMLGATMAEKGKVELERKLTGALAHELRNPLSAIDSALATMPDNIPDEAKELVASMQLCSSFMSSIMNNLLDSRKLEEGKMELLSNPMSLKVLVQAVHKMMLPAVNSNVKLVADVESLPKEKEWVYGDFSRLQQVLTNLVSNACKFTRKGSITISASWKKVAVAPTKKSAAGEDDKEWVQLLCRDTGPGIPKEDQANMFNRFTTRGGAPGSGLGLAIARQIVDLYGGSIHFESDPTVKPGTDCVVMLPLEVCREVPQQEAPETQKAEVENTAPLEEPLKVLITDDIKMNRMMLKRRFQKCLAPNCVISEAATGEEAVAACEKQQFDCIIMDQYMQEASGVMLGTDTIIALRRAKVDAVIIGCSGNDIEDKFAAAGADVVWKKPVPSNVEIIACLRQLLSARGKI